jgi:hypothetical protein
MVGRTVIETSAAEQLSETVCKFPALLNEEDNGSSAHGRVNIEVPPRDLLQGLVLKEQVSLQVLVQTIWAIALKTFTGDESICAASSYQYGEERRWDLFTTTVDDEMTFTRLLKLVQNGTRPIGPIDAQLELPCNSGVCMLQSNNGFGDDLNQVRDSDDTLPNHS